MSRRLPRLTELWFLTLSFLAVCSVLMCAIDAAAQGITLGADFNTDASLDMDGDNRWEDTAAATGLDFEFDASPAVTRMTGVSSLPGITAAYDFPGGSTGNNAGALLSAAGTGARRSFQNVQSDWSNDDVSIEIWFKPDNLTPSVSNGQILFEDGGGRGLGFFVDNNELRLRKAGGGSLDVSTNISALGGEFIQAVGTYDSSAGAIELFVNGASVGTDSGSDADWSGGDNAATGTRGGSNTGGIGGGQQNTESFDGQIAIFRAYHNQVLSATDVLNNFDAVSNNAPAPVFSGVLEYDAAQDDGANNTWENTGGRSGFDANLSGHTFNNDPSTSLPGVTAAYEFDGTGGGSISSLDGLSNDFDDGDSFSFEAVLRPTDLTGSEVVFETGGGRGVGVFLGGGDSTDSDLMGLSDSQLSFSITEDSHNDNTAIVSADLAGIGVDEFIHAIGTFDIDSDTASLYVNGELIDTATAAANITDWSGGDGAGLGLIGGNNMGGIGGGNQGFSPFTGEMALFRILDRALSQEEVTARFDAVATDPIVPEPASIAIWSLMGLGLAGFGVYRRRRKR